MPWINSTEGNLPYLTDTALREAREIELCIIDDLRGYRCADTVDYLERRDERTEAQARLRAIEREIDKRTKQ